MSGETRYPLLEAQEIALELYDTLAFQAQAKPISIAGSIRRAKSYVGDAELVLVPNPAVYRVTEELLTRPGVYKAVYGEKRLNRWGDRLRGIDYKGLKVELYMPEAESFGYVLWLRTGPADDNERLMYKLNKTSLRAIGGAIWHAEDWQREQRGNEKHWVSDTKRRVVVPDELTWFRLLGLPFTLPSLRKAGVYDKARLNVDLSAAVLLDPAPIQGSLF